MQNLVVICRKWNKPKISMIVTDDELSFCIGLEDFKEAVKFEMGPKNGSGQQIDRAFQKVIAGIKTESTRILD